MYLHFQIHFVFYLSVKELSLLHDKHLNRPTLDDNMEEEHAIEIATQEITQVSCCCDQVISYLPVFFFYYFHCAVFLF